MLKKFIAVFTAAAYILAMSAFAFGDGHQKHMWQLADGVYLWEDIYFSTDRQHEHYIEYTPNENVLPVMVWGKKLTNKEIYDDAAETVRERGGYAVCGINADYYVVATGIPLGIIIDEGRLITSDGGNYSIGFMPDGTAFIDKPSLSYNLTLGGEKYRLGGINKTAETGDFFLFTDDFGTKTSVKGDSRNMILSYDNVLTPNCEICLTLEAVTESSGAVEIPEGKMVLTLTKDSDLWRQYGFDSIVPGESFTLEISSDEKWGECLCAAGCLYRLVEDGAECEGLDKIDKNAAPRTAVGIREDGSVIFYTVDGRQYGYSGGLTLSETAKRLIDMGCVDAGTMDGGGSTNIHAVYAGDEAASQINSPSGGEERKVSSYILLAARGEGSGETKVVSIRENGAVLFANGSMPLHAGTADETGRRAEPGEISWSAAEGRVDAEGMYTAPDTACTDEVRVSCSELTAAAKINVITSPDIIHVLSEDTRRRVSELKLSCGDVAELCASSQWQLMPVTAEDEQYIWSVQGNIGAVDGHGTFTASRAGGTGKIIVSAGECTASVDVVVKNDITVIDDFEAVEPGEGINAVMSQERSMDNVKYRYGSMRVDYDLTDGDAQLPLGPEQAVNAYASLWIYGDGSGNTLSLAGGTVLGQLDFNGWKQFVFPTSENLEKLIISGEGTGSIWFDRFMLTDSEVPDNEPPWLSVSVEDGAIYGSAMDGTDGMIEPDNISLTLDGQPLEFEYDELTGRIAAHMEETGKLSHITLTARDKSGNLHRVSAVSRGNLTEAFDDVGGHWAQEYIGYMSGLGVVVGAENAQGGYDFMPDTAVSRAQLAVMLCRWKNIDTAVYADTELDFVDAGEIPAWAADSVKAVYALNMIKGVGTSEGVYFMPSQPLTRAQAITMIGRSMEAGSMAADLSFADTEQIPAWAEKYVAELVFAGVISGYEDETLRPSDSLTRAQICKILTELT